MCILFKQPVVAERRRARFDTHITPSPVLPPARHTAFYFAILILYALNSFILSCICCQCSSFVLVIALHNIHAASMYTYTRSIVLLKSLSPFIMVADGYAWNENDEWGSVCLLLV